RQKSLCIPPEQCLKMIRSVGARFVVSLVRAVLGKVDCEAVWARLGVDGSEAHVQPNGSPRRCVPGSRIAGLNVSLKSARIDVGRVHIEAHHCQGMKGDAVLLVKHATALVTQVVSTN